MQIRTKELIEEVCREKRIIILDLQIEPHCIYLHADMPPIEAVNNMVRNMKRRTAATLCKEFPELRSRLPSLWTLHYFVSTTPEKPVKAIQEWIEAQPRFAPKKPKEERMGHEDRLEKREESVKGHGCAVSGT